MIECLNDCVGIAESVNEVIHVKEAQRPRHGPVMRRVTGRVLKEESISETLRMKALEMVEHLPRARARWLPLYSRMEINAAARPEGRLLPG